MASERPLDHRNGPCSDLVGSLMKVNVRDALLHAVGRVAEVVPTWRRRRAAAKQDAFVKAWKTAWTEGCHRRWEGGPRNESSVRARQSTRGLGSGLGVGGRSSRSPPAERSADERLSPRHGSSRTIGSRRSSRRRRIDASGGRRLVVAPSKSRSTRPRIVTATHRRLRALSRCG